jgi:uncharacterized protein YlxP (DUF503 family)
MHIGLLQLDLYIPHAHSLKEKRMAVRRLKDRLRKHYNVSVSELNHQELWQRAELGVVSVGPDPSYLEQQLSLALQEAERILPECMVRGTINFR